MSETLQPEYIPNYREITQEMLNALPSFIHKAIALDYVSKGYWRLLDE
jgi:hypothetical protein